MCSLYVNGLKIILLQTVYDEWFITLYNLVYTALPVLGMSLFEQVTIQTRQLNWSVINQEKIIKM